MKVEVKRLKGSCNVWRGYRATEKIAQPELKFEAVFMDQKQPIQYAYDTKMQENNWAELKPQEKVQTGE